MSATQENQSRRDRKRDVRLVVMTLAAVLLIWFVVGNAQSVEIHFWITSAKTSLIVVILISAALGAILGMLLSRHRKRS
jgi:uncharacterized integral membrane protein